MQAKLRMHPADYSIAVDQIEVAVERLSTTLLRFRYRVTGRVDDVLLPPPAPPLRANKLWETTCFEAFLAPANAPGYRELNFSPSSRWAAYDFAAYRDGMVQAPVPAPPAIELSRIAGRLDVTVMLSLDFVEGPYRLGLSAVIEEHHGLKSRWALNHPSKGPDFHHSTCFHADLPPAPAS